MATGAPKFKLTYDDYLRFADDGLRHEIIDGEDYVSAAPATRHQIVLGHFHLAIANFLRERGGGTVLLAPTDVLLSPHDVVEPDLVFISDARSSLINEKNITGPPDLAIEILSVSSRKIDPGIKRQRYELFGISEYWVADPDARTLRIWRLAHARYEDCGLLRAEAGERATTPLLPGLGIPLAELFA